MGNLKSYRQSVFKSIVLGAVLVVVTVVAMSPARATVIQSAHVGPVVITRNLVVDDPLLLSVAPEAQHNSVPPAAIGAMPLAAVAGTVKSHQKISDTAGSFTGVLNDGDRFGQTVASLGDLDGDGVPDVAVGAFLDNDGGPDRAAVWILFMNADGTVKSEQKISDTAGGFTGLLDDGDQFGVALARIGDLNGDGVADLAVGARFDDDGGFK